MDLEATIETTLPPRRVSQVHGYDNREPTLTQAAACKIHAELAGVVGRYLPLTNAVESTRGRAGDVPCGRSRGFKSTTNVASSSVWRQHSNEFGSMNQ